jgi:hypothetical protein
MSICALTPPPTLNYPAAYYTDTSDDAIDAETHSRTRRYLPFASTPICHLGLSVFSVPQDDATYDACLIYLYGTKRATPVVKIPYNSRASLSTSMPPPSFIRQ